MYSCEDIFFFLNKWKETHKRKEEFVLGSVQALWLQVHVAFYLLPVPLTIKQKGASIFPGQKSSPDIQGTPGGTVYDGGRKVTVNSQAYCSVGWGSI